MNDLCKRWFILFAAATATIIIIMLFAEVLK